MTGEFQETSQDPRLKLATIEQHFDTVLDPSVVEFAHLLSERLNPEVVPMGFAMGSHLLLYDLNKGVNGFTSEPINSSLVQQSRTLYDQLQERLPALAEFAYSSEFAAGVKTTIEEVTGKPLGMTGKTVEEVLAQPVEFEQVAAPGRLPEDGVVVVAAELPDGTKLYTDQELMLLENEFDPATYRGPYGSAYGNFSLEMLIHPIVAMGAVNGRYFGLDGAGLQKLTEAANGGMVVIFDPNRIPDLRQVKLNEKTLYFPTSKLLENMGVVRRGVDAPEADSAGLLTFLMNNSPLGDENPSSEEFVPEVDLPGQDPFEILRNKGELPAKGMLMEAKLTRGGNAVFQVFDYDNLDYTRVEEQGEDGEYQFLYPHFQWNDGSKANLITFSYEQADYHDKEVQPCNRSDTSYIGYAFEDLDLLNLANRGRLLITKQPHRIGNESARLDQTSWKNNLLRGQTRNVVRWFTPDEVDGLSEAVEAITSGMIGIDPRVAQDIKQAVADRVNTAKESGNSL